VIRHGPGLHADPEVPIERWGGRKAQQYVKLTLAEYGHVCWNCGLPGADTADHVIPRSLGGAVYNLANLAPSHRRCNEARGNRPRVGPTIPIESGMAYFEGAA
jgi:5-methylcytosine-specific restriction endonuclease McrA